MLRVQGACRGGIHQGSGAARGNNGHQRLKRGHRGFCVLRSQLLWAGGTCAGKQQCHLCQCHLLRLQQLCRCVSLLRSTSLGTQRCKPHDAFLADHRLTISYSAAADDLANEFQAVLPGSRSLQCCLHIQKACSMQRACLLDTNCVTQLAPSTQTTRPTSLCWTRCSPATPAARAAQSPSGTPQSL